MPTEQLRIDSRGALGVFRAWKRFVGPSFTLSSDAIRRYAYTDVYRNTIAYFEGALRELGFGSSSTRSARWSRETGGRAHRLGSASIATRTGTAASTTGRWASCALEVCRLNDELGLGLPLQLISFLEEEGSASGRCCSKPHRRAAGHGGGTARRRSGRSTTGAASGSTPNRRASSRPLEGCRAHPGRTDGLDRDAHRAGQGLQDTGNRIGIISAIAGYVHADVVVRGRGDHAGATLMGSGSTRRQCSQIAFELERLAVEAGRGTVGTVEIEVAPGLINAIAERPLLSTCADRTTTRPGSRSRHRFVRRGRRASARHERRARPPSVPPGDAARRQGRRCSKGGAAAATNPSRR